jgi:hypothetical protein
VIFNAARFIGPAIAGVVIIGYATGYAILAKAQSNMENHSQLYSNGFSLNHRKKRRQAITGLCGATDAP